MQNNKIFTIFVFSFLIFLSMESFGKKLDLKSLQGKYDYVVTPDTSIACPETITVVYNEAEATLDSELFHFSNIDRGSRPIGGLEKTPDHSSYTEQWINTKVKSDSVIEQRIDHSATTNTSSFPQYPLNQNVPSSVGLYHIADSWSVKTTLLKFKAKSGILKQTVTWENFSIGPNCAYQKSQN